MDLISVNPSNGKKIDVHKEINQQELAQKINNADKAFKNWSILTFKQRADFLSKLGQLLIERKSKLAELMTLEMGKPILQAEAEIEKCKYALDFYIENSESFLSNEIIESRFSKSYINYSPIGTLLGIMPWNFPFWQVFRFIAPQLMAGNVILLKHSNNTTSCAVAINQLFIDSGLPNGIFQSLVIDIDKIEEVILNPIIKGISFTGSTRVGKIVASQAGSVMKKCVFELGGSDPYIICDDADLDFSAKTIVNARYNNAGQTCISPKRIIVSKKIHEEFVSLVLEYSKLWKCDYPSKSETNIIGPIARFDLLETFANQISESIALGANCLLGGKVWPGEGFFYEPTVLINIKPGMPAYNQELFGPAIVIIEAEDEEDAIRIANDTEFGLGGAVFSQNIEKAEYIAQNRLNCGAVFINDFVQSDPKLPFGGIKDSGYGREIGELGIKEFMNIKTICINK